MRFACAFLLAGLMSGCASTKPDGHGSPPPTPPMIGQAPASQDYTLRKDTAAAQSPTPGNTDQPANAATLSTPVVTLHVRGLGCPLCATNVKKAIQQMNGVQNVTVDLGKGTVTVTAAMGQIPTDDQFSRTVTDSGFTLERVDRP